ncbi:MAG: DUF1573 domain-containing protein [Chitinophagales bacterium]|jgi:hypothetical protein|nr:DUF1573 domain-containing protein [Chitinophagales bacterium]
MKKIVVFACIVLLGATFQSCRKKGNPYAGIPSSVLKDTTTVEILERTFNFDTINQDDTVVHIFKVKNTGAKNLIIGNAFGSCGCTVPEWPKEPVAPGAEASIRVKFNSAGKEGEQNKAVTLQVNTISHSEQLLLNGFVRVPKKEK